MAFNNNENFSFKEVAKEKISLHLDGSTTTTLVPGVHLNGYLCKRH